MWQKGIKDDDNLVIGLSIYTDNLYRKKGKPCFWHTELYLHQECCEDRNFDVLLFLIDNHVFLFIYLEKTNSKNSLSFQNITIWDLH